MRILHVTPSFYPNVGGVENYVLNLCLNLRQKGYQCDVLTLKKTKNGKVLTDRDEFQGISVTRISHWGPERFRIFPHLSDYAAGYDLLHVHGVKNLCNQLILSKLRHKKPIVVSTHGGFFHTKKYKTLKNIYFRTILPTVLKKADKVIAVSNHDGNVFRNICSNLAVIPNGIDYRRFSCIQKFVHSNTCFYYGRLSRNKRLDNLIKTFSYIRNDIPDIQLIIAGADWEGMQQHLENLIRSKNMQDHICFVGQIDNEELLKYMAHAHLFVSASEYEGFGITVLEAMASGTIPAVNDIEPLKDFVNNGENGFLVDFSRPKEAAKRLNKILKTTPKVLSHIANNAKATARLFAWEIIVESIAHTYINCCNNTRYPLNDCCIRISEKT